MGCRWIEGPTALLWVALAGLLARADQPDAPTIPVPEPAAASQPATPPKADAATTTQPPAPDQKPAAVADSPPGGAPKTAVNTEASPADPAAAATERLRKLDESAKEDASNPARAEWSKALREALNQRLSLLKQLDEARKARSNAEHPRAGSEREAEEIAQDAAQARQALSALRDPAKIATFLPETFRKTSDRVPDEKHLTEMKDAIGAAQTSLKELRDELDSLESETERKARAEELNQIRARREKRKKTLAGLAASASQQDAALGAATTVEARELIRERIANVALQSRIENERVREDDALVRSSEERARHEQAYADSLALQIAVVEKTVGEMQARYRTLSDRHRVRLEREAESSRRRADRETDPVERYRLKREAVVSALEAQIVKDEKDLTSAPGLALADQKRLADRAQEDLEGLRTLVEGGRSTTLVALRLANSYRRIAQQRESVVARDLAAAGALLTQLENELTSVELDALNDDREDREEFDSLSSQLTTAIDRDRARRVFEVVEKRHQMLLERRRAVLTKLVKRAEETRNEIVRRIALLDEQYAFIRTHIFWVRDAQPIGTTALRQCLREALTIAFAVGKLSEERLPEIELDDELALAILGVFGLPWPLYRARVALRRRIDSHGPRRTTRPA